MNKQRRERKTKKERKQLLKVSASFEIVLITSRQECKQSLWPCVQSTHYALARQNL